MATDIAFKDNFPVRFDLEEETCNVCDTRPFCQLAQWTDRFEFAYDPGTTDVTITNPTFAGSLTGWTAGSGWAYNAGHARITNNTGTLSQAVTHNLNDRYKITFTISNYSGPNTGGLQVGFGGDTTATIAPDGFCGNGTFTVYLFMLSSGNLIFTPLTNDFILDLDDIVVELIDAGTTLYLFNTATNVISATQLSTNLGANDTISLGFSSLWSAFNISTDGCYKLGLVQDGISSIDAMTITLFNNTVQPNGMDYCTTAGKLAIYHQQSTNQVVRIINPTDLSVYTTITVISTSAISSSPHIVNYSSSNNILYISSISSGTSSYLKYNASTFAYITGVGTGGTIIGTIIAGGKLYVLKNGGSANLQSWNITTDAVVNTIAGITTSFCALAIPSGELVVSIGGSAVKWITTSTDAVAGTTSSTGTILQFAYRPVVGSGTAMLVGLDSVGNQLQLFSISGRTLTASYACPFSGCSSVVYNAALDLFFVSGTNATQICAFNPRTLAFISSNFSAANGPSYLFYYSALNTMYSTNAASVGGNYEMKNTNIEYTTTDILSECYNIKAEHECTKLLKWTNEYTNGFQYPYYYFYNASALGFHRMRVESDLRNAKYPAEESRYIDSGGNDIMYYTSNRKQKEFIVAPMPEYMHDALSIGLLHKDFYIDSDRYVMQDAAYTPEWGSTVKLQLAQVRFMVAKYTQNLKSID